MNDSEKHHLSAETLEDAVLGRLTRDERARVDISYRRMHPVPESI